MCLKLLLCIPVASELVGDPSEPDANASCGELSIGTLERRIDLIRDSLVVCGDLRVREQEAQASAAE